MLYSDFERNVKTRSSRGEADNLISLCPRSEEVYYG